MGWLDALAGLVTGVLSGWGIGGGSLLMLYATTLRGMEQGAAQGINLLYFLPVSAGALPGHIRGGLVDRHTFLYCVLGGLPTAALAAWIAPGLDASLLKKIFGAFLLLIGLRELFAKEKAV